MDIPKIVEHKINTLRKPDGSTQYTLTLPKQYAQALKNEGIDTLYIIYNKALGAFPKIPGFTEKALTTFMQQHTELQKLFTKTTEPNQAPLKNATNASPKTETTSALA